MLARRRRGLEDDDAELAQLLATPRPAYTGTIAEGAGVRKVLEQLEQVHGGAIELTAEPRHGNPLEDARRARRMTLGWYLAVSALIFCIGAGGVLVRRNPLVVLLCLELMLNAANLALVTFARMHGGEAGQIFALIVMVVAACEVTVGLGLIVAISRRNLPIDVDELHELNG